MNRCIVRRARHVLLAVGVAACGDRALPVGPEPVRYETARFVVEDYGQTPADVVRGLSDRLELEFDRVGEVLPEFDPPPTPILMTILPGEGIPYVTFGENSITQWRERLAPEYFSHHLTHLYTRYGSSIFGEEGLAVYVTQLLQRADERPDPYRGQSPHAWVSLFQTHRSTISLFTALRAANLDFNYRGSSADASAWQLFLQAGSFTRWMIETHGRDTWLQFYRTASLATALGQDTPTVERAWLEYVAAVAQDPLPCEEALGDVRAREAAWCIRARGG